MSRRTVGISLLPEDIARLEQLIAQSGQSRSSVIRDLIVAATGVPDPEPCSPEELVLLLSRKAREGHVRAIELLLTTPWQPKQPKPANDDPFSEVDELAERRSA
jgi:hypothetical protein